MYLVFDIGGTKLRVGVAHDFHTISEFQIIPVPQEFNSGMALLKKTASELLRDAKVTAIAGGVAGPLNKDKTKLLHAPNLPQWIGKDIAGELSHAFSAPVLIENDAAIVGLGEAVYGAGKENQIVAYLTLSTGVGGARFVDQKIDQNAMGFEPGHMIVDPNGPLCLGCQVPGHLEAFVGGSAIERRFGKKLSELPHGEMREVVIALSIGITNIIVTWSPDVIVLGGKGSEYIPYPLLLDEVRARVKIFKTTPHIKRSQLGDIGGLYGALALLKDAVMERSKDGE